MIASWIEKTPHLSVKVRFSLGLVLLVFASGCSQGIPPAPSLTSPPPSVTPQPTPIPYQSPQWAQQAVIYEIFVRSYADSDGDGIGDLRGIQDRLDYIASLGVDLIWLMPIYPSPSLHGYDVTDFFDVNPEYGTRQDLIALVEAVHARGMRIILDFVPSHLSNQNPLFNAAYANPDAENADWFVFTNAANTRYAGFADANEMPRFNHYNPAVVDYLIDAALFWLDLDQDGDFTDGVDGFRVDNVTFPPQEFFVDLRQAVKTANPEALLLGEAWVTDPRSLSIYYQDQFDALFDFPLYAIMEGNQNSNGDGLLAGSGHPILVNSLFDDQEVRFPAAALTVRFLSNHDTNRIAAEVHGDLPREKLAAAFLASLPGPLLLYYGEEIGMWGQQGSAPHWDNYRREPMDWFAAESGPDQTYWFMVEDRWNAPYDGISVEEQDQAPDSLLNYYRLVLRLRRDTPALNQAAVQFVPHAGSGIGTLALSRGRDPHGLVAVFNFSAEDRQVVFDAFPYSWGEIVDLLTGVSYPGALAGQPYTLNLPPASAVWLTAP